MFSRSFQQPFRILFSFRWHRNLLDGLKLILILGLVLCPLTLQCQDGSTGALRGTVLDAHGRPLCRLT